MLNTISRRGESSAAGGSHHQSGSHRGYRTPAPASVGYGRSDWTADLCIGRATLHTGRNELGRSRTNTRCRRLSGLTRLFAPGTSSEWTLERYLEGLYLIAKHSSSPASSGATLVPESRFVITSEPQGAEILVNGEFAGGTPTTRTVAPGQYMVEVSKLGSRSWLRSVKIKAGDSVGIHAELQSLQPKSSGN